MSVCGTGGIMPGDIAAEVNLIVNLLNYNLYTYVWLQWNPSSKWNPISS